MTAARAEGGDGRGSRRAFDPDSIRFVLPRAILFDLDDTILMVDAVADSAWRRVCDEIAPRAGRIDSGTLFGAIGATRAWYWSDRDRHRRGRADLGAARREIVARTFERLGIDRPELVIAMADGYTKARTAAITPFPGAIETLERLASLGVALALITNGAEDVQRAKIVRFGLARFFRSILIEGAMGMGKPDPAVYRRALADLAVHPHEAWFVGDHLEWDVSAPQALGIHAIWHDHEGRGLAVGSTVVPDRIVRRIAELVDVAHRGGATSPAP